MPRKSTKKKRRKGKGATVKDLEQWIENQYTSFLDSKSKASVRTAYVAGHMSIFDMTYVQSDTEEGATPREGYIYCKLWANKKSRLYMYKGIKNKTRIERKIMWLVVKMLLPLIIAVATFLGVYVINKNAAKSVPPADSAVEMELQEEAGQDATPQTETDQVS